MENIEEPQVVAIKVLKETANREAEEDFLREVDIMSTFKHPNILSLLGVVLRGNYEYISIIQSTFQILKHIWSTEHEEKLTKTE